MVERADIIEGTPVAGDVTASSQYDWETTTASTAVVETLANALNREPESIGPLYEHIDPDALDAVIENGRTSSSTTSVSFTVACYEVYVDCFGTVSIETLPPSHP